MVNRERALKVPVSRLIILFFKNVELVGQSGGNYTFFTDIPAVDRMVEISQYAKSFQVFEIILSAES